MATSMALADASVIALVAVQAVMEERTVAAVVGGEDVGLVHIAAVVAVVVVAAAAAAEVVVVVTL